jgi:hypothetical protein
MHDLEEEKKIFFRKTTNDSLDLSVFIANVTVLEAIEMPHSSIVCFLFQWRLEKKKL